MDGLKKLEERFGGKLTVSNMKDTDYPNQNVFWLRFQGAHCPICHCPDWCLVNVNGTKVICMRNSNDNPIKAIGGYLYKLDPANAVEYNGEDYHLANTNKKANTAILDIFNRLIIMAYPLVDKNRAALKDRGLSDEDIDLHMERGFGSYYVYKDFEKSELTFAQAVWTNQNDTPKVVSHWNCFIDKLDLPSDSWKGVPGFSEVTTSVNGHEYKMPKFEPSVEGLLVPYYNVNNELVGFQSRVDNIKLIPEITCYLPKDLGFMNVSIDSDNRTYEVRLSKGENSQIIASGEIDNQDEIHLSYNYAGESFGYSFRVKKGGKYFWVSSSNKPEGSSSGSPVQVAYQPKIAQLEPDDPKLQEYVTQDKSVWLTEGGLKAYVTSCLLQKNFDSEKLMEYGADVLAVAGVNAYRKFLPILQKLNVRTVTTAFDMDFLSNDQVAESYTSLLNLLKENRFKVRTAIWNPNEAKGIDDALAKGLEIKFVDPFK